MTNNSDTKRLLWFIFAGSRGGTSRLQIISKIRKRPLNTNQLAKEIGLDYKSIQHHIKVLEKNNLVTSIGEKYGVLYSLSAYLEANIESFDEIRLKLDKST